MEIETQKIKSGNGSVNVQANTVILNTEFDENKVKEISEYSARQIMNEYFNNANDQAKKRMDDFEDIFIPRLATIENALEIFKDPAFTLVYRKAQIQAACSGKTSDYNILTELLIHRFNKKENKKSCIGINGAIEIIEQITDDALTALTVATSIDYGISPVTPNILEGLNVLNNLYASLFSHSKLPYDLDWLDQLDILKTIRLSRYGKFKKLEEFYFKSMEAYTLPGIRIDSEAYNNAMTLISAAKLNGVLIKNEILDDYVRLPLVTKKSIEDMTIITPLGPIPISQEQKDALYKVYDLYDNNASIKEKTKKIFIEKFNSFPALNELHKWWNSIPNSFDITIIGRVLGHANAQRCFPGYPPLD